MEIVVKSEPSLRIKAGKLLWIWQLKKRIVNNPIRNLMMVLAITLLTIYVSPIFLVIWILLVSVILFYARRVNMKIFRNVALELHSYFPDGYSIIFNNEGFANVAKGIKQWKLKSWDSISPQFAEFEKEGIFALYQQTTKTFHLFFRNEMKESDYKSFVLMAKNMIQQK